jgi:hypothetical protein
MSRQDQHAGVRGRILEPRQPAEAAAIVRLGDPLARRIGRGLILPGGQGPAPAEPQVRRSGPATCPAGRRTAAA